MYEFSFRFSLDPYYFSLVVSANTSPLIVLTNASPLFQVVHGDEEEPEGPGDVDYVPSDTRDPPLEPRVIVTKPTLEKTPKKKRRPSEIADRPPKTPKSRKASEPKGKGKRPAAPGPSSPVSTISTITASPPRSIPSSSVTSSEMSLPAQLTETFSFLVSSFENMEARL